MCSSDLNGIAESESLFIKHSQEINDVVRIPLDDIHSSISSFSSSLSSIQSKTNENATSIESSLNSEMKNMQDSIHTQIKNEFSMFRSLQSDTCSQHLVLDNALMCKGNTLPTHTTKLEQTNSQLSSFSSLNQPSSSSSLDVSTS